MRVNRQRAEERDRRSNLLPDGRAAFLPGRTINLLFRLSFSSDGRGCRPHISEGSSRREPARCRGSQPIPLSSGRIRFTRKLVFSERPRHPIDDSNVIPSTKPIHTRNPALKNTQINNKINTAPRGQPETSGKVRCVISR